MELLKVYVTIKYTKQRVQAGNMSETLYVFLLKLTLCLMNVGLIRRARIPLLDLIFYRVLKLKIFFSSYHV